MLQKIKHWLEGPRWLQVVLVSGMSLFFFMLGQHWLVRDNVQCLQRLQQETMRLYQQIIHEEQEEQALMALKKSVEDIKRLFWIQAKLTPTPKSLPSLLETFMTMTRQQGLTFESWLPLDTVKHRFYAVVLLQLSLRGDTAHLLLFLKKLSHTSQIVSLEKISMDRMDSQQALTTMPVTLHVTLRVYERQNFWKGVSQEVSVPDLEPVSRQQTMSQVASWKRETTHFVGVLRQGETTWGLLQQEAGRMLHIKPGDCAQEGCVTRITDHAIWFLSKNGSLKKWGFK